MSKLQQTKNLKKEMILRSWYWESGTGIEGICKE